MRKGVFWLGIGTGGMENEKGGEKEEEKKKLANGGSSCTPNGKTLEYRPAIWQWRLQTVEGSR